MDGKPPSGFPRPIYLATRDGVAPSTGRRASHQIEITGLSSEHH